MEEELSEEMKRGFLHPKKMDDGVLGQARDSSSSRSNRPSSSASSSSSPSLPTSDRFASFTTSGGEDRLGSARGIPQPKMKVGETEGLTWAPVTDSVRARFSSTSNMQMPWKAATPHSTSQKGKDRLLDDGDTSTIATASTTQPSLATATTTTASSFASSASSSAMLAHSIMRQPVLPHGAIIDDPKSCLAQFYSKEFQITLVTKECYFSWPDPHGLSHDRRFSSVFVCPITGEFFCTAKYGPREYTKNRKDPLTLENLAEVRHYYVERKDPKTGAIVVWFNDKSGSQHGAAARAHDCLSLRKYKPLDMTPIRLAKYSTDKNDEQLPYMSETDAPPLPSTIPMVIRKQMNERRAQIRASRPQSSTSTSLFPTSMAEAAKKQSSPSLSGMPKAVLASWYGVKPRSTQLSKGNYCTYNNLAAPHLLKFTSVFVCPLTGEIFWSGKYGSVDSYEQGVDLKGADVIWYSKKIFAEHAAAARAYDCWCFRLEGRQVDFMGQDLPYRTASLAPTPPTFPVDVRKRVAELQAEAKSRMPIPFVMQPPLTMPRQEEVQQDRDEYRAVRIKMEDDDYCDYDAINAMEE